MSEIDRFGPCVKLRRAGRACVKVPSRRTKLVIYVASVSAIVMAIIMFLRMLLIIDTTISCTNLDEVNAAMRHLFLSSGRRLSPHLPPSTSLQDDVSFSEEKLAMTLSQISTMYKVETIDCRAIMTGSQPDINWTVNKAKDVIFTICDEFYINITSNCKVFQAYRGYIMSSLTKEEEDFPLAFSLIVYKDAEMVERLLRAIYRPQNYYCIHVDRKSSDVFFQAMSDIANCFPNVIIASKRIDVQWGEFTVLEPELLCMEELWRFPKWKYFFTLTGQEFPLKTNYELVKILTALNGANDVMTTFKYAIVSRWRGTLPPHGLIPVKGSVHITVNREFVDFILHNEIARSLLEWTKTTWISDETFFAVLNANPQLGIRGVYKGEPEMSVSRPFLSRYKSWDPDSCAKRRVRGVCILTTGDLPTLTLAKQFFTNKFFLSEDRVVIGCLEEKIFNDTRDEYLGIKTFNTSYYSGLDIVRNQVLS